MSVMLLKKQGDDILLRLVLQPKASRDAFIGLLGDELKITITAPPVDGQANKHLIKFLSKQFKVPKRDITVEKGLLNKHKLIRIKAPKKIPDFFTRSEHV